MIRLILVAAALLVLFQFRDRLVIPLFRLPGDFRITVGNTDVFIPLATCALASLLATLLVWLM